VKGEPEGDYWSRVIVVALMAGEQVRPGGPAGGPGRRKAGPHPGTPPPATAWAYLSGADEIFQPFMPGCRLN